MQRLEVDVGNVFILWHSFKDEHSCAIITAHLRAHEDFCTTQRREREGYNWYNMDGSVGKDLSKHEEINACSTLKKPTEISH